MSTTNDMNLSFTVFGEGSQKGRLENGRLVGNSQTIIVDEKAFQPGTIPGINRIWLESSPGVLYDFTIKVEGACPAGKTNNKLIFTDESGDSYTLRIYSTTMKEHYVNYHSNKGDIVKITWDI